MKKGSVAVVGCGWLGTPLASELLAQGYKVLGTTTRPERIPALKSLGIEAMALTLPLADFNTSTSGAYESSPELSALWSADQLVLNVPPGRGPASAKTYPAAVLSAVLAFRRNSRAGRIILVSSTGVYGKAKGVLTESTPLTATHPRAVALALAEAQVQTQAQRPAVVVRLGGLYGGERHPGKYLAGKQDIANGDAPVNLTSRRLAITTITRLLDHPFWPFSLLNVVDEAHPTRREFYTAYAQEHSLVLPTFLPGGQDNKRVESELGF